MPTTNKRVNLSISPDLELEIAEYMKDTNTFMWSRAICALLVSGLEAYKSGENVCPSTGHVLTAQEKRLLSLYENADKAGKEMAMLILTSRATDN